jgi:uncharacterized protein (UPF0548 family)
VSGLTYPNVGATRDDQLPDGYRHLRVRSRVGTGEQVFTAAVSAPRSFAMQRGAGVQDRVTSRYVTSLRRLATGPD